MRYLHTMVRVGDLEASLRFFAALGLTEVRRSEHPGGRFTLVYLSVSGDESAEIELTHNWDPEQYTGGRNFGHIAFEVDDIYDSCQRLLDAGVAKDGTEVHVDARGKHVAAVVQRPPFYTEGSIRR
jgi:lactoylglutathione lyase